MQTENQSRYPKAFTVRQVAQQLNWHPRSVWRAIAAGRLKATRLGLKTVRIMREDLEQFIEEGRK